MRGQAKKKRSLLKRYYTAKPKGLVLGKGNYPLRMFQHVAKDTT